MGQRGVGEEGGRKCEMMGVYPPSKIPVIHRLQARMSAVNVDNILL